MLTFCHAESDVYLVRLGDAGLILHADEQARRLRTSKAKRYTAVKDLNSPLPTVALCPSLEFASNSASKARYAKLTFHFSCLAHAVHRYFEESSFAEAIGRGRRADEARTLLPPPALSKCCLAPPSPRSLWRPTQLQMLWTVASGACWWRSVRACPLQPL